MRCRAQRFDGGTNDRDKGAIQAFQGLMLGALASQSREREWSVKTTLTNIFIAHHLLKDRLTDNNAPFRFLAAAVGRQPALQGAAAWTGRGTCLRQHTRLLSETARPASPTMAYGRTSRCDATSFPSQKSTDGSTPAGILLPPTA